jgi:hypothetical protein
MPELSIVMGARNDNYGGEVYREGPEPAVPTPQKDRMRLSFKTLHQAFKDIDYEVVFVEWNPVEGKEKISDWDFMKHPRVRIIEVDNWTSNIVLQNKKRFHEMHAKNVGIRRSKGIMVLCTNPDVLWIHPIQRSILALHEGVTVSWRWTVYHQVLDYVDNLYTVAGFCLDSNNCIDHDLNSNGDFTLMSLEKWRMLKGYSFPRELNKIAGNDMWQVQRAKMAGLKYYEMAQPIYHVRHPGRPLESGYGITEVSDDWGLPQYDFKELRGE